MDWDFVSVSLVLISTSNSNDIFIGVKITGTVFWTNRNVSCPQNNYNLRSYAKKSDWKFGENSTWTGGLTIIFDVQAAGVEVIVLERTNFDNWGHVLHVLRRAKNSGVFHLKRNLQKTFRDTPFLAPAIIYLFLNRPSVIPWCIFWSNLVNEIYATEL